MTTPPTGGAGPGEGPDVVVPSPLKTTALHIVIVSVPRRVDPAQERPQALVPRVVTLSEVVRHDSSLAFPT